MAGVGHFRSEEQSLCSICQDVFTDPVTIPCGHNFCKPCISEHWSVSKETHQCPMCKEDFDIKPQLKINTLFSEMIAQNEAQHEPKQPNVSSSDQPADKPGEVPCDICPEPRLKALKFCLVCLTSYCQTHLEPHLTVPGLRQHQLIHPVKNLENEMCRKHDKPLELFCKTDHTCICQHCKYSYHKHHYVTPLKHQYEEQKLEVKKTEADIQQMIQKRRLKIQEIQQSVELSNSQWNTADRQTAEGVEVFTALMDSALRSLNQLQEEMQEQQRTTEKQAEDFIKELEQEICELEKRSTEVEQLLGSENHLHFVQRFTRVKTAPPMKTWTKVHVHPPSYEETVERAVSDLEDKLTQDIKKKFGFELKRVQEYEVELTLDPDTADPVLVVSDDGKQVHSGGKWKYLPYSPWRFDCDRFILAKQNFGSGRFYFEVQVKGKNNWALGVVSESIDRKGEILYCPKNGYWIIWFMKGNECYACAESSILLSVKSGLQKVGVFVDTDEHLVSFYDVDSSVLICSFTECYFREKLLPFFCPGCYHEVKNSAPLIITPVDTE